MSSIRLSGTDDMMLVDVWLLSSSATITDERSWWRRLRFPLRVSVRVSYSPPPTLRAGTVTTWTVENPRP